MIDWPHHYATRTHRMVASEIRELLKLIDQPDIISFAGGIPDPRLFPTRQISAAYQKILAETEPPGSPLQYAVSEGYRPLREWLAADMTRLGAPCAPENIIITSGSQQGLDFLGKLFLSPHDLVLLAWPTYLGALQAFNCYEPQYAALPWGNSTPRPLTALPAGTIPKFGYCMPEFQNPTGTSLDLEDRQALLQYAETLNFPIIEDTAYERLRYSGDRIPSLLALDIERNHGIENSRVIYCGTFSKTLAPGLRIGWMVAPEPVIQKLVLIKQASDLHVSTLSQMVAHQVASEIFDSHTRRLALVYKSRRDAMLHSLRSAMPTGVSWTEPEGGMFIWLTLPEHIDTAELLKLSIQEARVAFVPGNAFFADRSSRNHLRLSFSLADEETIDVGIRRLAALIARN